jgi:hypothetical protein
MLDVGDEPSRVAAMLRATRTRLAALCAQRAALRDTPGHPALEAQYAALGEELAIVMEELRALRQLARGQLPGDS